MRIAPAGRRLLLIGLAAAFAVIAGACAGTTASPAQTTAPLPSSAAPGSTPPASSAATAGPTATFVPDPSFVPPSLSSDKDLEAALPTTYDNVVLTKSSFTGAELLTSQNQSNKDLLALVQSLGKSTPDLSFAVATDPTNTTSVVFGAYRIKGTDATAWAPQLYQIAQNGTPGSTATDVTLGGHAVKRVSDPKDPHITYAWPRGDKLFIVVTTSDDLAGPAIAAVP
jgi:hypothetical protein